MHNPSQEMLHLQVCHGAPSPVDHDLHADITSRRRLPPVSQGEESGPTLQGNGDAPGVVHKEKVAVLVQVE